MPPLPPVNSVSIAIPLKNSDDRYIFKYTPEFFSGQVVSCLFRDCFILTNRDRSFLDYRNCLLAAPYLQHYYCQSKGGTRQRGTASSRKWVFSLHVLFVNIPRNTRPCWHIECIRCSQRQWEAPKSHRSEWWQSNRIWIRAWPLLSPDKEGFQQSRHSEYLDITSHGICAHIFILSLFRGQNRDYVQQV